MKEQFEFKIFIKMHSYEHRIKAFWEDHKCFEISLRQSLASNRPLFTFYDGPPFATGLPHYGHILAGTIKDVVTRYWHQKGYHVERRFGWDCHGLPVEYEIDKRDGIVSRSQITGPDGMGVKEYNRRCREIVMRNAAAWEHTVLRMGRWIDFRGDYKTMTPDFMESVWWVFSEMFKKGLIYHGSKVMPFSIGCGTPLSNFEAGENYKEVTDPALTVSFVSVDSQDEFLAWTTTPWTLPSNMALCVNPSLEYVKVKCTNRIFVLAKDCLSILHPKPYEILEVFPGTSLIGRKYNSLFPYTGVHLREILGDAFVTNTSGTGIVHIAPAFGEDDNRVFTSFSSEPVFCPVNDNGYFTSEVKEYEGKHIKDASPEIIKTLKMNGRIVHHDSIKHNYPFCWRSNTPLIYKIVPSWFVDVPKLQDSLVEHNRSIRWVPECIGSKRFHNWISDAKPWCISRSRFWGTPIPIWKSDDSSEMIVIESIQQLRDLSGIQDITDIHRDSIDDITIVSPRTGKILRRIDPVFDCWFESGSMPYAQQHYPFENKEKFMNGFPADFIAEGLDQTRGWFYTLLIISTALFDRPPFMNVIVNGLVLASDGEKMSKSKNNYEPPLEIIEKYGADAVRMYLVNSPAVHADPLKFREDGIKDVVRDVFIPLNNVLKLWQCVNTLYPVVENVETLPFELVHVMDKWIVVCIHTLIDEINNDMRQFHLFSVLPKIVTFVDNLSRWYINFNKIRIKSEPPVVLGYVLYMLCRVMSPFTPFWSEHVYQTLKCDSSESVHYLMYPEADERMLTDHSIIEKVSNMQKVVCLGREVLSSALGTTTRKFMMTSVEIFHNNKKFIDDVMELEEYVRSQLNVFRVGVLDSIADDVFLLIKPDNRAIGKKYGKLREKICQALKTADPYNFDGFISLGDTNITLLEDEYEIVYEEIAKFKWQRLENGLFIRFDPTVSSLGMDLGIVREITSNINKEKKRLGFKIGEFSESICYIGEDTENIKRIFSTYADKIPATLKIGSFSGGTTVQIHISDEKIETVTIHVF